MGSPQPTENTSTEQPSGLPNIYGSDPLENPSPPAQNQQGQDNPFSQITPDDKDFYNPESIDGGFSPVQSQHGQDAYQQAGQQGLQGHQQPPQQSQQMQQPSPPAHTNQYPIPHEEVPSALSNQGLQDSNLTQLQSGQVQPPSQDFSSSTPATEPYQNLTEDEMAQRIQREIDRQKDEEMVDFSDEKDGILKPFGKGSKRKKRKGPKDKKSREKLKVNDFDKRNNLRNRNKIAAIVVIVGTVLLIALAGYKVFLARDYLTTEEVAQIAGEVTGATEFPLETGASIAEGFVAAYLDTSEEGNEVLGYYYGGSSQDGAYSYESNRSSVGKEYLQKVISGPYVFEKEALSDTNAYYVVGALVTAERVEAVTDEDVDELDVRKDWIFFNVNVFYNYAEDSFSITPDSPTVVARPNIVRNEALDTPPGTGVENEVLLPEVTPTLIGFFEKYAESSASNWEQLKDYVVSPFPDDLKTGLDSQYTYHPETMEIVVYETDTNPDDPTMEIRALVKIQWEYSALGVDADDGINFSSTYLVFLKKTGGAYKIYRVIPNYFFTSDDSLEEIEMKAMEGTSG